MEQECDNQNLRIGVVEEATHLETENNYYLACQKYIEAKYKINVTIEEIPSNEILKWKENENLPEQLDVLMFVSMILLMESRIGDKYKAFSFPIRFNPLLCLSKPPSPQTTSTTDFFNFDFNTAFFLMLCLILVSAFWSISHHLHISFKSSNAKSKTNIISTFLENLWNSSILFFFEPYTFIPKTLSIRILTGVWLLGVLVLSINFGSVMRSSFSFVTYKLVDSLKDLRNSKPILPKFLKGGLEERIINLKSVDNEDFRYVRDHVTEDTFLTTQALFYPDLYTQLKENEYLFIDHYFMSQLLGFLFRAENFHNTFYISKPISEDYMVFPYGFNSSRCHKINHIFEKEMMEIFETQWVKPIYFRDINLMKKLQWKIPDSETKAIQFQDLLSVDLLFCYGIVLSFILIIIELITTLIKKPARKTTLRRKRLHKIVRN